MLEFIGLLVVSAGMYVVGHVLDALTQTGGIFSYAAGVMFGMFFICYLVER